jgi:3-oxo-5alpha-steroid 4-dehydrogenase
MGKGDKCRRPFDSGPYFAISLEHKVPTNPITSLSMGGLRVAEETGAVVDREGALIKGLYAAGRTALGIPSNNYVSGLSLADCVWSGRRAARAIAEAVRA